MGSEFSGFTDNRKALRRLVAFHFAIRNLAMCGLETAALSLSVQKHQKGARKVFLRRFHPPELVPKNAYSERTLAEEAVQARDASTRLGTQDRQPWIIWQFELKITSEIVFAVYIRLQMYINSS